MVGILIVSHGGLAESIISVAQYLVGKMQKVKGISIWPKENKQIIQDRIRERIAEVNDGDGVVILMDILAGTPTNLSLSMLERERVEVVTGVNVPMLLAVSSYRKGRSLEEISRLIKKSGRRSIRLVGGMLKSGKKM
jgi:mannose PTS system EIIA component